MVVETQELVSWLGKMAVLATVPTRRVVLQAGALPILNQVRVAKGGGGFTPVLTGTLRRSYSSFVDAAGTFVLIGTDLAYAPHVEFGTRFMAAQPHLRPSFMAAYPAAVASMAATLRGLMNGF